MRKMKSVFAVPCAAFSGLFLASVFAASPTLPKFIDHRDYLAADNPSNLATGDLNGDGIADLVVPNFHSNNISVLLGKANGSFQQLRLFDDGVGRPFDAVIADFNGDGKNDVAVTIPVTGVLIMLGDGAGHLSTTATLPAGASPTRIVTADFNGDHKPDLAVTNQDSNNVSIFLNRGDGTFTSSVNRVVGAGPVGIVAGDFNGDGKVDLAVADSGVLSDGTRLGTNANTIAILLGAGTGRFQPPIFVPVAKTPVALAVADLNKDTKQDLVVSSKGAGLVSVLLGNGSGNFQTPRTFTVPRANNLSLADVNSDGNTDLLVTQGNLSDIALLLGDGAGNFGPLKHVPSGRNATTVLAGDFNHDGKADYITANGDSNTVSVVLGKGNATFIDIGPAVASNGASSNQIIAADFNNDGFTDLAQVNTGIEPPFGSSVSIMLGKSGGGVLPGKVIALGKNGPTALAAADLNNDGHLDLAVTTFGDISQNSPSLVILLGNGDGTFGAPKQFVPGPGNPKSIAIADFNRDGKLDAVIAQDPRGFGVGGVSLLLGNGLGGFGTQKLIATVGIGQLSTIVAGDFNRDGKNDIAYLSATDLSRVILQLGNGNGTFQTPKVVTAAGFDTPFSTFGIGDFNNDGILDFAVEQSGVIQMLLGNGDGNFTFTGTFPENTGSSFSFVSSLVLADFNGDGVLDVGVPDGFAETVSLLLGNGDGTLRTGQLFGGTLTSAAVAYNVAGFQPGIAMATQDTKVRIIKNTTP